MTEDELGNVHLSETGPVVSKTEAAQALRRRVGGAGGQVWVACLLVLMDFHGNTATVVVDRNNVVFFIQCDLRVPALPATGSELLRKERV